MQCTSSSWTSNPPRRVPIDSLPACAGQYRARQSRSSSTPRRRCRLPMRPRCKISSCTASKQSGRVTCLNLFISDSGQPFHATPNGAHLRGASCPGPSSDQAVIFVIIGWFPSDRIPCTHTCHVICRTSECRTTVQALYWSRRQLHI